MCATIIPIPADFPQIPWDSHHPVPMQISSDQAAGGLVFVAMWIGSDQCITTKQGRKKS